MASDKQKTSTEVEVDPISALMGKLGDDEDKKNVLGVVIKKALEKDADEKAVYKIKGSYVDDCIAALDEKLNEQMDAILHNEKFQALESTWRGLHYLVQETKFIKPVRIEVLDVSKEDLRADLEGAQEGDGFQKESGLWHHAYWNAYDLVGGHAYTSLISDYQFDSSPKDIRMLRNLSNLSEDSQLPIVASANAQFFGEDDFGKVMNNRNLKEILDEDDNYIAWRDFRNDDRSRYIGLTLPQFLGRSTYGKDTAPVKNFNYEENVVDGEGKDQSLWCRASFALAANMVKSFEKWGWSVKTVGKDAGGKVENLPSAYYKAGTDGKKKPKIPMETRVGLGKDTELCERGFIPLNYWEKENYAVFFETQSMQRSKKFEDDPGAEADSSIGTRLQYMMLVTRIAHYLKYRQLAFVGKNAGAGDIKKSLTEWLDTIVSDYADPAEEVIARKPLRSYTLDVKELEERPGVFQIQVEFRPHVAIVGMDINLKLVAYHSDGEA